MLLYNVTLKVDKDIEAEWLEWMKQTHIPDVLGTGQFITSRISKLLEQPEEEETTYVVQYECESMEKYNHYLNHFAPAFRAEFNARYKDRFVAFRTLMEVVASRE